VDIPLYVQYHAGQLADAATITVAVNVLKITSALKAFVGLFSCKPTYLRFPIHLLHFFQNINRSKQLLVQAASVNCPVPVDRVN